MAKVFTRIWSKAGLGSGEQSPLRPAEACPACHAEAAKAGAKPKEAPGRNAIEDLASISSNSVFRSRHCLLTMAGGSARPAIRIALIMHRKRLMIDRICRGELATCLAAGPEVDGARLSHVPDQAAHRSPENVARCQSPGGTASYT
jgi:hypothetical protein